MSEPKIAHTASETHLQQGPHLLSRWDTLRGGPPISSYSHTMSQAMLAAATSGEMRVLMLGLGGGTIAAAMARHNHTVTAVEVSASVARFSEQHFFPLFRRSGVDTSRIRIIQHDAAAMERSSLPRRHFHLLCVDVPFCYERFDSACAVTLSTLARFATSGASLFVNVFHGKPHEQLRSTNLMPQWRYVGERISRTNNRICRYERTNATAPARWGSFLGALGSAIGWRDR